MVDIPSSEATSDAGLVALVRRAVSAGVVSAGVVSAGVVSVATGSAFTLPPGSLPRLSNRWASDAISFLKSPSCRLSFGAWALLARVLDAQQQRRGAAEQLRQRADEADACRRSRSPPGRGRSPACIAAMRRLERRAVRVGHPPLHRRPCGFTFTFTPHGGSFVRNALQLLEHLLRLLVRHDPATDDRRRLRQHLVRRPLDRAGLLGDDRDRRLPPGLLVGVHALLAWRSCDAGQDAACRCRQLVLVAGQLAERRAAPCRSAGGPGRRSRGSGACRCSSTAGQDDVRAPWPRRPGTPPAMPLWTGIVALCDLDRARPRCRAASR